MHSFFKSLKGQYSQKGQRVQRCHQHHENQQVQQSRGGLSHRSYHEIPTERIRNRSREKCVFTAVM